MSVHLNPIIIDAERILSSRLYLTQPNNYGMIDIMKICKRCGKQEILHKIKVAKNCFRFWCETCCEHYDKWQHKKLVQCIRTRYHCAVSRCTDGSNPAYKDYGGRGIQVKFENVNNYINYIINDLKGNTLVKIRELDIDRIDNDGHYEKGNLRLVSHQENCHNRIRRKQVV